MEADAYMRRAIRQGHRLRRQALDADPKNYQALVLLAKSYATTTHVNDLDKEEKLTKSGKVRKAGLEMLKTAEKPVTRPHRRPMG